MSYKRRSISRSLTSCPKQSFTQPAFQPHCANVIRSSSVKVRNTEAEAEEALGERLPASFLWVATVAAATAAVAAKGSLWKAVSRTSTSMMNRYRARTSSG